MLQRRHQANCLLTGAQVSGDLILPNPRAFLHRLADVHRTEAAAITTLMYKRPAPDSKHAKRQPAPLYAGIARDRLGACALRQPY